MKPARLWAFICPRTVLSLTRIGMLTPATTSAPVSRATARLRLVGVSPSMSVKMIDPAHRAGDALADRVGGVAVGRHHARQAVERTEDALENLHHLLRQASVSDHDDSHHDE